MTCPHMYSNNDGRGVKLVYELYNITGQLLAVLMLAVAIGFDAFSLGIGIGMRGFRYRQMIALSSLIGLLHILFPIIGIFAGKMMSGVFGMLATYIAGGVLIYLGINMIIHAFGKEEEKSVVRGLTFFSMLAVAISVSLDSFSVGLSLGMITNHPWMSVGLFGVAGLLMSLAGLLLGKTVRHSIGEYGEALGGVVLTVFGVYFIV